MGKSVIMHTLMSFMLQGAYEAPPTTITATPTTTPPGCYDGYGCFPIDGVWAGSERPVSLHPLPPINVTPTYCLYTPTRPRCHVLDVEDSSTFTSTSLHKLSPLILLTHGYLESTQLEWVQNMVASLMGVGGDVGVVTVDWYKAAPPPYAQAVANIRLVGVMVARFMGVLADVGVAPGDMHLIGHSLGAHLMAYAANAFNSTRGMQVGRVTGLDPAGPYFTHTPTDVRLDPTDAAFVDVIHTDSPSRPWEINSLGSAQVMGHVDFYPNGGRQQAGCQGSAASHIDRKETVAGGVLSYLGCSHQRSYEFFTESVRRATRCRFMGVVCASWEEYKAGACWGCEGGRCVEMGYTASPSPSSSPSPSVSPSPSPLQNHTKSRRGDEAFPVSGKRIFLGTNPDPSFCAEQYRVTLVTGGQRGHGDLAHFTVTLRGDLDTLTLPAPPSAAWVEGGGRVSWVGWGRGDLGGVYNLRVEYEDDQSLLQALVWRFRPPTLYVEAFIVEALSAGTIVRFPFCGGKMEAGQSYTLLLDATCQ